MANNKSPYIMRKGANYLSDLKDGLGRYNWNQVWYVDSVNGSDGNSGRSWDDAYATIDKGIDQARYLPGTTTIDDTKDAHKLVLVAPGHYNEGELLFSGYNITIEGVGPGVPGKDYGVSINYDGAADATAAMAFSGSGITLRHLHIYCDFAAPAVYCAGGDNNLIEDCVIECDGTLATYGIRMDSMKGSWIRNCVITGAITAGIYVNGGANHYYIHGGIQDTLVYSSTSNTTGILVDNTVTAYNSVIERCKVSLATGSSAKGIDVNCTGGLLVVDNRVSVPASATPIEHAGGDQFLLHNATAAGTVNADPYPTAA